MPAARAEPLGKRRWLKAPARNKRGRSGTIRAVPRDGHLYCERHRQVEGGIFSQDSH